MMKLALMRTPTGKEDTELPLLQRMSSFYVKDISQHKLFREDCVNQAFMVELLKINHY
jgi:hypothetical protein